MHTPDPFAAKLLRTSASAYAARAADLLLDGYPRVDQPVAPGAFRSWQPHLHERILELAAALEEGEPALFVSRIHWTHAAFRARGVAIDALESSLRCLANALSEVLPERAAEQARSMIEQAIDALAEPPAEPPELTAEDPLGELALRFLVAGLEGDGRGAIDHLVRAHAAGTPIEDLYQGVLLPAQREVGQMWHRAEIDVAEEHFVTVTTRRAMSVLCHLAAPASSNGRTVVAAAVAGNRHDIGLWAVSDLFDLAGWRAICLGADVPAPDIRNAVSHFGADLLVLSATLTTQIRAARKTIETVRMAPDQCVAILLGGLAFREVPHLWERLDADGHAASGTEAVRKGASLVGLEAGRPNDA